MKSFVPARDFTGYPDGKSPVHFKKGVESDLLADKFVELMHAKGLVSDEGPKREVGSLEPPSPAAAKKIAAATSRRTGKASRQSHD